MEDKVAQSDRIQDEIEPLEEVILDLKELQISPDEKQKVIFEEELALVDSEDRVVDTVTVVVEEGRSKDTLVVYQYSEDESHLLRVKSKVQLTLESLSELRRIQGVNTSGMLRVTDAGSKYNVFRLTVTGKEGKRMKFEIPMSEGGLILEGANIVLLRKIASDGLSGRLRSQTVNHEGEVCEVLYEVERGKHDVRVQRTVKHPRGAEVMTTVLGTDGRILQHHWSSSDWHLVSDRLRAPSVSNAEDTPQTLTESEPELKADQIAYFERKEALIIAMKRYLQDNPDVQDMIADLIKTVLFEKPDDVIDFADRYFSEFLAP